jgi:hypothetical protein
MVKEGEAMNDNEKSKKYLALGVLSPTSKKPLGEDFSSQVQTHLGSSAESFKPTKPMKNNRFKTLFQKLFY